MSATKAALRAAKSALDAGDYDTAIGEAQKVLTSDSKNYFGLLFLGRAFEKQGKVDDAAKAYHSAAELKPDDSQAWLGLCSLYEAQGGRKVDEYRGAAVKAAEIFAKAGDREKERCQTTVDKLVSFSKQYGTKAQYKRALEVLLPGTELYEFLEGRIPRPGDTYMKRHRGSSKKSPLAGLELAHGSGRSLTMLSGKCLEKVIWRSCIRTSSIGPPMMKCEDSTRRNCLNVLMKCSLFYLWSRRDRS